MKKLIILVCLAFLGSTYAQEHQTVKKEKDKGKMEKTSPDGKDKMEVKKDKSVKTKDDPDKTDQTEVTKTVKHTVKHKPHGKKAVQNDKVPVENKDMMEKK